MKLYLVFFFSLLFIKCFGQEDSFYKYQGHATLSEKVQLKPLLDKETKSKYTVDSSRIYVSAIDSNRRLIWRTDPWKDNKLDSYRVSRPTIVRFYFANSRRTKNKQVIWIIYNNTQFGFLDEETGKFTWLGQD